MRVVVDANVIVSGLIVPIGPPGRVLDAWRAGRFELVTSVALIAELTEVLTRRRIERRLQEPTAAAAPFDQIDTFGIVVSNPARLHVVDRDPDDDRIIEAAVSGGADVIVSGDADLLSLGHYGDVPIVTPALFLAILEESGDRA